MLLHLRDSACDQIVPAVLDITLDLVIVAQLNINLEILFRILLAMTLIHQ